MSSDSAKENASVVDSSVSEWKQDIGNSDDPGGDYVSSLVSNTSCELWGCHHLSVICSILIMVLPRDN